MLNRPLNSLVLVYPQRHLLQYILPLAGADNPELLNCREPILKFVTNDIADQVKVDFYVEDVDKPYLS